MIDNYQEEQAIKQESDPQIPFAKIHAVYADGVQLLLDGEEEPTKKRFKCMSYYKPQVNDYAYIVPLAGSYLVIGPKGNPASEIVADRATTADSAYSASSATNAENLDGKSASDFILTTTKGANNGVASLNSSGKVIQTALNSDLAASATNLATRHTGSTLGFYNKSPITIRTVLTHNTTPTVDNLKTKVNELIAALDAVGLINS